MVSHIHSSNSNGSRNEESKGECRNEESESGCRNEESDSGSRNGESDGGSRNEQAPTCHDTVHVILLKYSSKYQPDHLQLTA